MKQTDRKDFAFAALGGVLLTGVLFASTGIMNENAQVEAERILRKAYADASIPYERRSTEGIFIKRALLDMGGDCKWLAKLDMLGNTPGSELVKPCETVKARMDIPFRR